MKLVSQLRVQAGLIQEMQLHLPPHLHRALPGLPTVEPEEVPEKRLQPSRAVLERYQFLMEQRFDQLQLQRSTLLHHVGTLT